LKLDPSILTCTVRITVSDLHDLKKWFLEVQGIIWSICMMLAMPLFMLLLLSCDFMNCSPWSAVSPVCSLSG